jgi:hypothetical protein
MQEANDKFNKLTLQEKIDYLDKLIKTSKEDYKHYTNLQASNDLRAACNKLTPKQRKLLHKRGMKLINGSNRPVK